MYGSVRVWQVTTIPTAPPWRSLAVRRGETRKPISRPRHAMGLFCFYQAALGYEAITISLCVHSKLLHFFSVEKD